MKKIISLVITFFVAGLAFGESNSGEKAANALRGNNKLSVVIAVLIVIFAGIIFFLISQEVRLRRIEKKSKN